MTLTENDKSLLKQMIRAGRHAAVWDLLPEYNLQKSKQIIEEMGEKWVCHPANSIKKLEAPMPILTDKHYESKYLNGKK